MLIIFPRVLTKEKPSYDKPRNTGNVIWQCEYCNEKIEVCSFKTSVIYLVCPRCRKSGPECNKRWHCDGMYMKEKA